MHYYDYIYARTTPRAVLFQYESFRQKYSASLEAAEYFIFVFIRCPPLSKPDREVYPPFAKERKAARSRGGGFGQSPGFVQQLLNQQIRL